MPQVTAEAWVPVPPGTAFAVSQTTGEVRLRWDPLIRAHHLLGAPRPATGVRTFTRARLGSAMIGRYVSYRPPTSVATTMEKGPWFLASFDGGWRFVPETRDGVAGTRATWTYTWTARPVWLRPLADPVGRWLLGRGIRSRVAAYAEACGDPAVLGVAHDTPPGGLS